MNKNSIIFKLTLFFVILFIIINALLYFYFTVVKSNFISFQAFRYVKALKIIRTNINNTHESLNGKLSELDLEIVSNQRDEIINNSTKMFVDDFLQVLKYDEQRYVVFNRPPLKEVLKFVKKSGHVENEGYDEREAFFNFLKEKKINLPNNKLYVLLKDNSNEINLLDDAKKYALFFTLCIDILLISFYIYLYRKFKPLKILKNDILRFANGDLSVNTKVDGFDEISNVSNEFNEAIVKIRALTESRNLFLRNIMHELKTPITKGKLLSDTLENNRKKELLQKAFYRLEYLLSEFAKIEELTSGKIKLKKNSFAVEDLLNQAMDILLLDDKKLDIRTNNTIVNVDFELFSIALKNLIDNSIKYNTNGNPEVIVSNSSITVRNKGDNLKKDINEYFKPFNREYESIEDGLGLGLYITQSILKIHGFNLSYIYKNGYHSFIVLL